jgi:hypothetical protein
MTVDTMQAEFPDVPYIFEASGYTREHMAPKTPDVLEKLKAAIERGQCEFMGSPYAHPMLPNFPQADGLWSIRFSNEVYERLLGFRPKSFWNPECGWRSYVPTLVVEAGYINSISILLENGTPVNTVQSRAGHSKASVTTDIYGNAMAHSLEQAAQMIEEIVKPLANELLAGCCRFLPPRKRIRHIWYGCVREHRRMWGVSCNCRSNGRWTPGLIIAWSPAPSRG